MAAPAGGRFSLWPDRSERAVLGRFYLAETIGETLNIIDPFVFVYLFLVMERPEWAIIPFFLASAVALVFEIPTGVWADRWGRKQAVVLGYTLSAGSWLLIPLAVSLSGPAQLAAVCACFILDGLGESLVAGAEEAWVVDNLESTGNGELAETYFARVYSFGAMGGVIAGSLALGLLIVLEIERGLLDALWVIAASGQLIAVAIYLTIPEHLTAQRQADKNGRLPRLGFWRWVGDGARVIIRRRPLALFFIALVTVEFAGSAVDDAFVISMITKGFDARGLAPLGLLEDLFGLVAPLLGLALAQKLGATRHLVLFLLLPALGVLAFFGHPGVWTVVVLGLLLTFCDSLWDPIADARLYALMPSRSRATVGSMVNQAAGLAELVGIAVFAWLLGEHSEALTAAVPDILEAFSGGVVTVSEVPVSWFGLPVPDLAIVMFVLSGALAVPFIVASRRCQSAGVQHRADRRR